MQDWSEGYTTDVAYTYGYYPELNPLRSRMALLDSGIAYPEVRTACELGFGQGVSVNMHAAASTTEWHATDFNPSHAGFARQLAGGSPLAERLRDESFEEFCRRANLPDFDFIGLHGIWSWISDSNRHVIADFLKRKLKVGGVLYISYNTQPGWAAIAPIRDLLTGFDEVMTAPGTDRSKRIEAALDFADKLLANGALYGAANPIAAGHMKTLREQNRNYLAHEYFNHDWTPMPFAHMAEWMTSAKLQFAGSAYFTDRIPALHLSTTQRDMLSGIPDTCFRETTRDFMVNQRFRRDYWVRGARRLSRLEQTERMRDQRMVLAVPAGQVELKVSGAVGEATMQEDVYKPILEVFSDHEVHTLGEIERAVERHGIRLSQIQQAALVLTGTGALHPAQDEHVVHAARSATKALNTRLFQSARHSDIAYLASPVTGGAINVGRFEQLFLLARSQGMTTPGEWARYASDLLAAQGQRVIKDGKAVDSVERQLDELTRQAMRTAQVTLPVMSHLGILD